MKFIQFIIVTALLSNFSYGQTKEISIKFISNCGLLMSDGTTNIYSDFPYRSGAFIYDKFDKSEIDSIKENSIFIFTHTHGDHYSRKNMKHVLKNKNGKKYGKWNIPELENLGDSIPEFKIEVFRTKHLFSIIHYSYLITWHGKKIFLSGDAEDTEIIEGIKDVEWAFVPGWLLNDILIDKIEVDTKMFGLYHIGRRDDINIIHPKILVLDGKVEAIKIAY